MLHSIQIANSAVESLSKSDSCRIAADIRFRFACVTNGGWYLHPGFVCTPAGTTAARAKLVSRATAARPVGLHLHKVGAKCAPHLTHALASIGYTEVSNFKCSLLCDHFFLFSIWNWKNRSVYWILWWSDCLWSADEIENIIKKLELRG